MHYLRRHRRFIASLAASWFLVVWGVMAVTPCLMAAEAIAGEHCPHCPDPPPPCHDDGGATCTYVDGYDFDGRTLCVGATDLRLAALVAFPEPVPHLVAGPPGMGADAGEPPEPGGPRLHLRHCVLLD